MTTRLRLTRDTQDGPEEHARTIPAPGKEVRTRLVAGRVNVDPAVDAPAHGQDQERPPLRLQPVDGEEAEDAPFTTPALIQQIEETLDRMQDRLNKAREQVEDVLKFPSPPEETWPPRAA